MLWHSRIPSYVGHLSFHAKVLTSIELWNEQEKAHESIMHINLNVCDIIVIVMSCDALLGVWQQFKRYNL